MDIQCNEHQLFHFFNYYLSDTIAFRDYSDFINCIDLWFVYNFISFENNTDFIPFDNNNIIKQSKYKCLFCNIDTLYLSTDGVRKHARKKHYDIIKTIKKKPEFYCIKI